MNIYTKDSSQSDIHPVSDVVSSLRLTGGSSPCDIQNEDEIISFLEKIAVNNTILFTNGNSSYISTVIKNLLKTYQQNTKSTLKFGVFCSDSEAYKVALENEMTCCFVDIPSLKINDPITLGSAGSEFYLRLCFVKIILVKFILELGYDVLYIDPDMAFVSDCVSELLNLSNDLTFAKVIPMANGCFINSNIIRAFPTNFTRNIFDFSVKRDIQTYLNRLPDVSDETFLSDKIVKTNSTSNVHSVNTREYPSGADSKFYKKNDIKMFHANCIVGLEKKISYLKENGVWLI